MIRKIVFGALVLLLFSVGGWLGYSQYGQSRFAPSASFQLVDGRRLTLAELRGQPVLITFWATSCRSCVEKIPALIELYRTLSPRGLEIIAVAMAYDPPNRVMMLRQQLRIPYPIALDLDGSRARLFDDVSLTPTTVLIDPEGRIVAYRVGELDIAALRKQLEPMLTAATG
jgi:thiol-disulfide isomerase/thioredoxin